MCPSGVSCPFDPATPLSLSHAYRTECFECIATGFWSLANPTRRCRRVVVIARLSHGLSETVGACLSVTPDRDYGACPGEAVRQRQHAEGARSYTTGGAMSVDYVCEHCGFSGRDRDEDDADFVLCSQCGEQVIPLPRRSGIVTTWDED